MGDMKQGGGVTPSFVVCGENKLASSWNTDFCIFFFNVCVFVTEWRGLYLDAFVHKHVRKNPNTGCVSITSTEMTIICLIIHIDSSLPVIWKESTLLHVRVCCKLQTCWNTKIRCQEIKLFTFGLVPSCLKVSNYSLLHPLVFICSQRMSF